MNKSNGFLYSFIGLIIFQIIMSMEQIIGDYTSLIPQITGKIHLRIPIFPVLHISDQAFMFISLIIIILLFVFLGLVFLESRWSRILAVILGVIEIINGVLHIFASFYFSQYIPGSYTAIGVIIFGVLIILLKPSFQQERIGETQ